MTTPPQDPGSTLPCLSCGYDLRGLEGDSKLCPECGTKNIAQIDEVVQARRDAAAAAARSSKVFRVVLLCSVSIMFGIGAFLGADLFRLAFLLVALGGLTYLPILTARVAIWRGALPDRSKLEHDVWFAYSGWFIVPWLTITIVSLLFPLAFLILIPVSFVAAGIWLSSYLSLCKRAALGELNKLRIILCALGALSCIWLMLLTVTYWIWAMSDVYY